MRNINVGLVGFGAAGRVFHEPVITSVPGLNISKIYQSSSTNLEILKTRYPENMIASNRSFCRSSNTAKRW